MKEINVANDFFHRICERIVGATVLHVVEQLVKKVVRPRFATEFSGAVIREGADELILRVQEEGVLRTFSDTLNEGDQRWGPPPVDADWHAFCQANFQGIEGSEREAVFYRYNDLHQVVKRQEVK